MTAYIKISTMAYPLYEGDIRLQCPGIAEDLTGADFPIPGDYAVVQWVDPPTYDHSAQFLSEGPPANDGSGWKMVWVVSDLSAKAIANIKQAKLEYEARNNPKLLNSGSAPDVIG